MALRIEQEVDEFEHCGLVGSPHRLDSLWERRKQGAVLVRGALACSRCDEGAAIAARR